MKVLLINPQYVKDYVHTARWDGISVSGSHWYPIFLAYCTGLLEKNFHECKLIDAEAEDISYGELLSIAKEFIPNFTVIYVSSGIKNDIELARRIKEKTKSKIIMVGPWCTMNYREILKSSVVDHLIDGEFEFAVKDIVGGSLKKRYVKTQRLTKSQIDELPWVSKVYKEHLNVNNYEISSLWHPFSDLFTGRRCYWGKCIFCLWPFTIQKEAGYVTREIKDVLDEIEWAAKNLKVKEIFIQDDTLPGWRAKQLSEGLIKRKIVIRWSAYARGDLTLTPEILRLMKKAGCHCLHVGYESGSDKILKTINKGVTREGLEKFTKWVNDAGIDIHADFMIGLPGETKETIKDTINFAKGLKVLTYQFAPPRIYPCTPFYFWTKQNKYLDKDGIMRLPNMTITEIENWCKVAMKECYMNVGFVSRVILKPREIKRLVKPAYHTLSWMTSKKAQITKRKIQ